MTTPRLDNARSLARVTLIAALTPLLEKNALKTRAVTASASRPPGALAAVDVPFVFSMSRLIVLAFAIAMFRQVWYAGVAGWPDATLSISIVLALPILHALEGVSANDVVHLADTLVGRFGEGAVRSIGGVYATEPSKFDDHRHDT